MGEHGVEGFRPCAVDGGQHRPRSSQRCPGRLRGAGRRASCLVNGPEQGAAQASLGFDELRNGCGVAETAGQRAKSFAAHNVSRGFGASRSHLGQAVADMGDQFEQIRTVNGWIVEAGLRPVPVGVQAATAAGDDRAFLAGLAQPSQPLLTGSDTGMLPDGIKGVVEDIQPSGRRAVERCL